MSYDLGDYKVPKTSVDHTVRDLKKLRKQMKRKDHVSTRHGTMTLKAIQATNYARLAERQRQAQIKYNEEQLKLQLGKTRDEIASSLATKHNWNKFTKYWRNL